jgi:hypothetical protein
MLMSADDKHRKLINTAFKHFIKSKDFNGYFYPGVFYKFCNSTPEYKKINSSLCNRVGLLPANLAKQAQMEFSKNAPKDETKDQARDYLLSAFNQYAIDSSSFKSELKKQYGSKIEDFKKYIPLDCIEYLSGIQFNPNNLPLLTRDHYKEFFKIMSVESFNNTIEFIEFMRKKEKPIKEILMAKKKPQTGFIYCFTTTLQASKLGFSVVKVGRTTTIEKRLKEHKGNNLLTDYSFIMSTHSLDIEEDEELLLNLFKSQPICTPYMTEDKELRKELFEIPELHIEPLFKDYLKKCLAIT